MDNKNIALRLMPGLFFGDGCKFLQDFAGKDEYFIRKTGIACAFMCWFS